MAKLLSLIKTVGSAIWRWILSIPSIIRSLIFRPLNLLVNLISITIILYLIFGLIGGYLIYFKKSETNFTKTLSALYPYPVAMVDSTMIWGSQYYRQLDFLKHFQAQGDSNAIANFPKDAALRNQVIQDLVDDRVVFMEAKKQNLQVSKQEIDDAIAKQGDIAEIKVKIRDLYDMNITEYKYRISIELVREKLKSQLLTKVRISQIISNDLYSIKLAQGEIASGGDFAEIAKKYSQDTDTSQQGGDLGYWRKGELTEYFDQSFEDKVFALTSGQVTEAITTKYGTIIVKVTDKTEGQNMTFDQWILEVEKSHKIRRFLKF